MFRRQNKVLQERGCFSYDHAAATGDTTVKLFKAPRAMRIESVKYVNPTGLATDVANYFNLKITNAAVVVANWSTETGQEGTLTADTFVDFTLSATDTELIVDAGDVLALFLDETGTATLPAGRVTVNFRYL